MLGLPAFLKNLNVFKLKPCSYNFIRCMAGRKDCPKKPFPTCAPEKLAASDCKKRKDGEKDRPDGMPKSMWYNPECCHDPCPEVMPRFDELYYYISDKAKRNYQITWAPCPTPLVKPKIVCNYDTRPQIPYKKRKRTNKDKVARSNNDSNLMQCIQKKIKDVRCIKVLLPGCKAGRDPPSCYKVRRKTKCQKFCTPYPSFSECQRNQPKKKHPIECRCLDLISMCEVWAEYRKRLSLKK